MRPHKIILYCSDCDEEFVCAERSLALAIVAAEKADPPWGFYGSVGTFYCPKCDEGVKLPS